MACALEQATTVSGRVCIFKHANEKFDNYTEKPNIKQQTWMQQHYQRMLAYTPYFDKRLTWYPNAWFYLDSYALYVDSKDAQKHPDWILQDAKGNKLYIPWQCHGKCEQFAGDFGNPEFRKCKINEIRTALGQGYRGVWLDDVNLTWRVGDNHENPVTPIDPRTKKPMTLEDWRRYFAEFMEEIRANFPKAEIAHNAIWYADTLDKENTFISRQIRAANYINIERGGNDDGLVAGEDAWGFETFLRYIDYVHQQGSGVILMDSAQTPEEREYGLATALLASNGNDFIDSSHTHWTTPDHWWPGYDVNLGEALNTRYQWRGLLRRDFECGQVLLNQPGLPSQIIPIESEFKSLNNKSVKKLQLPAKSAAILLKPCSK